VRPFRPGVRPSPRLRRSSLSLALLGAASLAPASCRSTATSSLADPRAADVEVARVAERRDSLEELAEALEIAALAPLAVPVPAPPDRLEPDQAEFWQACAFAWNPELRQARRELLAARAAAGSAGAPGPIGVDTEYSDLPKEEAFAQITATVDLLGLLGIGPAAAERALARAETRGAFGALERAVWKVRFDVERARVRAASATSRVTVLDALLLHASEDLPRIEVLARRGWIGPAMEQGALAALHRVEHELSVAREEWLRAKAELARVCGLDPSHQAFESLASGAVDRFGAVDLDWRDPSAVELLSTLPELRSAKLELAVAEAELRREARKRWPSLRLGPMFLVFPGTTELGGMLGVQLPFPGAFEGAIEAARQRREAAREAVEDELIAALGRIVETRDALAEALERLEEHAPELDTAVARMFVAAQARFRVEPEGLTAWSTALRERVESLTMLNEARADAVLAHLDYEEARGIAKVGEEVRP
jgi:hypothetical protein